MDINFQELSRESNGTVQSNCRDYVVSVKVYDGLTLIGDFTGVNALHLSLGGTFSTLTSEQVEQLLDSVQNTVIQMKAGLAT